MKKFISLLLSFVMIFTLSMPAFATDDSTKPIYVYADDGSYFMISENPIIVSHYSEDGRLVDKSQMDVTTNRIITQTFDSDSGKIITATINLEDITDVAIPNTGEQTTPNKNDISAIVAQPSPLYVYDDEPLLNNNGMSRSTIFPGWYEIGTYRNTIYPGYIATVVRKFSGNYYHQGEAHTLRITKGTPPSAIVAGIVGLVFSGGAIGAAVAAAFSQFIVSVVKDSLDVTFTYRSFHYLYQVGINSNKTPQHKYCRSVDFWYCEADNQARYEYRGATARHFNGTNHADQAVTAIADYTMGRAPTGAFCGIN